MAYVNYGQATSGGKQIAEALADLRRAADRWRDLTAWVEGIGPENLATHPDFLAGPDGQGFNDTVVNLNVALQAFMVEQAEVIARLARGS